MLQRFTYSFILTGFLCFSGNHSLLAQVWPGDVNNNGIVNNIDLLWYSLAYDETGPPRSMAQQGIQWENKTLTNPWSDDFPNGVNYAFADCDGDGKVDFEDHSALEVNFGKTHGTVTPDLFSSGQSGIDAPLFLEAPGGPIIEGNPIILSVNLGTESLPVDAFFGVAFTIRFDPDIFSDGFGGGSFSLQNESWIGDKNELLEISEHNMDEGWVRVAVARKDQENKDGYGVIGNFFIVIEDHVVGLSQPDLETAIWLEEVKLVDEAFIETAIFADTLDLTILNDDVVSLEEPNQQTTMAVFPNPVQHELSIHSDAGTISEVEIFNLHGQSVLLQRFTSDNLAAIQLPIDQLATGTYYLRLSTSEGLFFHPFFHQ